jgi:hypothetical protein
LVGAAHNGLGLALYHKRDLDGAIAEYREAIRLDLKAPLPHNNLRNVQRMRELLRSLPDVLVMEVDDKSGSAGVPTRQAHRHRRGPTTRENAAIPSFARLPKGHRFACAWS